MCALVSFAEQPNPPASDAGIQSAFPQTRWSLILDAQAEDPFALAAFCRAYWFPLYCYARRTGKGVHDAEDLTQAFFERILSRDFLHRAQKERGRLRSFLLHSFANFIAEEWRKGAARKRGAGQPQLSIEALSAEERLALEPQERATPEVEFERAWARELLRQAIDKLGAVYESAGKGAIFRALRDQLTEGSSEGSYEQIARGLGLSEAAARFAAFKLRQRFRATLRELVADTVANLNEVEDELAYMRGLFQV